MPVAIRTLYHWTHRNNLASIAASGLRPDFATGELYAVWGCAADRVDWARDHVACRHRWHESQLILLRCDVTAIRVYKTCWRQVFYTPCAIKPEVIVRIAANGDNVPLVLAGITPAG